MILRLAPLPIAATLMMLTLSFETAQAQPIVWSQRAVGGPSPRFGHAMAYDSTRGVTVLFGGYDGTAFNDETWEWNGATWTRRMVVGPSPRAWHAMVYDETRGVTVLFGGAAFATNENDTWDWNGSVWSHRALLLNSGINGHAMTYHAARAVSLAFGGDDSFTPGGNHTWVWNGNTSAWSLAASGTPSARRDHAMAYDSALSSTILFGGRLRAGGFSDATWKFHGSEWYPAGGIGPSPRAEHAMAYDASRGVTVLFGGYNGNSVDGETWEWSEPTWTQRFISGPSPRRDHQMAYDAHWQVTVLFGGMTSEGAASGETWQLGAPCVTPSFTSQPQAQSVCAAASATWVISTAGTGPFTYQWQWRQGMGDWAAMVEGLNTDAVGQPAFDAAGTQSMSVTIDPPAADVRYPQNVWNAPILARCIVSNACGTTPSEEAEVSVCSADFNCADGVSVQDIYDFLAYWQLRLPTADFNGTDGVTVQDIYDFLAAWNAGCP